MIWTREAEEAVMKEPFFVRRRVRMEVEKEAARQGAQRVLLKHVLECKKKALTGKPLDSKGYQIENCFGPNGCTNRANDSEKLAGELDRLLLNRDIAGFLKERTKDALKIHHEFRICFSDCPNGCSRPQISDIGIIGAVRPRIVDSCCTGCSTCLSSCAEGAIHAVTGSAVPAIDAGRCVMCGKCIEACPSGAIQEAQKGWRVLLGGKLGRHPQLGKEMEGIYSQDQTRGIIENCLDIYFANNIRGERLGAILNRIGYEQIKCSRR